MIERLNALNKEMQRNSDCYLQLTKSIISLIKAIRSYKFYQKINPLKGKQIIKILKQRT